MRGVEKNAQVSGLQTWAEGMSLMKTVNSGSWWGVDYNFGHDHVEFEVSEPGWDLLSGHWFIELWSLKNIGGVDRTWSHFGAINVCKVTGAMDIDELAQGKRTECEKRGSRMEPAKATGKKQPREIGKKPGALRRGYVKKEGVINRYCRETHKMNLRTENCPLNFISQCGGH